MRQGSCCIAILAFLLGGATASAQTTLYDVNGTVVGEHFGYSVCFIDDVSGDQIADVAVGAPLAEAGGFDRGEVRLHSGVDGSSLRTFRGRGYSDRFGHSIAAAGDVDGDGTGDLLVGAIAANETGGYSRPGYAQVFSGRTGRSLYRLTGKGKHDLFGWSVAKIGDLDGDGAPELAVGDPRNVSGPGDGNVTIFSGASGSRLFELRNQDPRERFGFALAGVGDVDQDGFPDLAVGAPGAGVNFPFSGSVRIHSGADFSILYRFHGDAELDMLGTSLAPAGDVDADGHPDILAGAVEPFRSGYARVFSGASGAVLHTFTSPQVSDQFGHSVAFAGDLDQDGFDDILVGANERHSFGVHMGRVSAFSGASGAPLFTLVGTGYFDRLGESICGGADLDGDGRPELVIGAVESLSPYQVMGPGYARVVSP